MYFNIVSYSKKNEYYIEINVESIKNINNTYSILHNLVKMSTNDESIQKPNTTQLKETFRVINEFAYSCEELIVPSNGISRDEFVKRYHSSYRPIMTLIRDDDLTATYSNPHCLDLPIRHIKVYDDKSFLIYDIDCEL